MLIDVASTLDAVENDGGTGRMIGDPQPHMNIFHGGVRALPIIRRDPPPSSLDDPLPHIERTPTPTPEQQVESGTSLNNAGAWASITSAFAPAQSVLNAINGAASNGGANQMLGPQMGFAPVDGGGTSSGGGMGMFIFAALAIVGVLVWMHFRKKHAKAE